MRCMRKIYICLLISICLIGIAGCDVKENGQKKETLAEANEASNNSNDDNGGSSKRRDE